MSVKYKCKFKEVWLSDERFKSWLQKLDSDMHDAFCKFWKKRLLIAVQSVKQTESHMKGEKYKLNTQQHQETRRNRFRLLPHLKKDTIEEPCSTAVGSSLAVEESSKHQKMLSSSK